MSLSPVGVDAALEAWGCYSCVIDARSESEFALDRLPGSVNWPSLNDGERAEVGTIYKQVSPFEAKKRGAALVAANIARHIECHLQDKARDWQPLIYCWRGGKRSNSLGLVLGQIGFRVQVLEGGYKAFRARVMADLPLLAAPLRFEVVAGATGTGKTRLLAALRDRGAQVLDLEALASHRSSVLGLIPGQAQPSQRRFETLLWEALRQFEPTRPVYVEAESKKIGNVAVPTELMDIIRRGHCVRVEMPMPGRVELLMQDYAFFADSAELLCTRLEALVPLRGSALVGRWLGLVRSGRTAELVEALLVEHYDPGYAQSTSRNFASFADAPVLTIARGVPSNFEQAANELLSLTP